MSNSSALILGQKCNKKPSKVLDCYDPGILVSKHSQCHVIYPSSDF